MADHQFAYIASPELFSKYRELQDRNNAWNDAALAWEKEHSGFRLAVWRANWGRYGVLLCDSFASIPEEARKSGAYRKVGKHYQPYKGERGAAAQAVLATVPQAGPILNLAAEPWNFADYSYSDRNEAGRTWHSYPTLEFVGDTLYVLSAAEQESAHLTPTTMSAYWAAKGQ